ncbi:unnamed protein product [Phaedon cochleariae]|uniref:DUF7869 domain-containing protein n=1 Tax=Phaedon cochleariae TaxID=80249 RepID=A0A9N9SBM8_PHACE|nr:unnamed protein product [Phaedon cochleariae]
MNPENSNTRGKKILGMLGIRKDTASGKIASDASVIHDVIERIISNVEANIQKGQLKEVDRDFCVEMEVDRAEEEIDRENEEETNSESEPFSDDSIIDPNYEAESTTTTDNEQEAPSQDEEEVIVTKKKTTKRKKDPQEWKRNKTKLLRNSGQAYVTLKKRHIVEPRQMKPPCGDNCKLKCSVKFSDEERTAIFRKYWDLADIVKQRTFIVTLMHEILRDDNNSISRNGRNKRTNNNIFYLFKDNQKLRVCKVFFISTLGITTRCIRSVISKRKEGHFEDKRGRHGNQKQIPDLKDDIRNHISSIPKIDSHYTRAHSEKQYIEGGKTLTDLYRDYKNLCEQAGKSVASLTTYRDIFYYEFNLAFFVPKKDQCQKCVSYENVDVDEKQRMEEDFLLHQREKTLSRKEKEADKKKCSENYRVSCFDLQATLPTPKGDVSSFYYKSKLSTYNFTVCGLTQKGQGPVTCFMWHEGQGKRGANEIGSCLIKYLQQQSETYDGNDLDIVFYSDNCSGQQKNKFVLAAYFYSVAKYNIKSITHKYLVTGHTQNEGDNVHSVIEKNIKRALKSGPIYTPDHYMMLVKGAKKTGTPYKVEEMSFDDFFDLKKLTTQTSFNYYRDSSGDIVKMNDACVFRVEKNSPDIFFYKTSFSQTDYKSVSIRQRNTRTTAAFDSFETANLECAYQDVIPIPKKKFDDLMDLLKSNAIKKCHSHFYNSLKYAKD